MLLLYRFLLLCYPAAFRQRFGPEMVSAFAEAWRDRRARGLAAALAWLPGSLLDPIANGWRERRGAQIYTPQPEGNSMIARIRQDFGFAVRVLRRQPGFALAAILTLALGIGATTAIFSVVDGVLLRPLGYRDPSRLGFVWTKLAWIGVPRAWINGYQISLMQDELRSVESLAAMRLVDTQLTGDGQPEQVRVGTTTVNLFDVLGVRPELGRGFVPEDGREGSNFVAVLGHALFEGRFGGDPATIGKTILLGGQPVKVIGVMPERFRFHVHSSLGEPAEPDLWAPATWQFRSMPKDGFGFALLLRARPGSSLVVAQQELDRLGARLDREQYQNKGFGWQITGVQADLVRKVRPALLVLLGAVGMVLLIGCANVASLFLVRAAGRSREFALRAAVGAGRWRIVSQLLAESVLLSGSAALLGCGLALAAVRALRALPGAGLPRLYDVTVDGRILLFAIGVALLCGIAFGLAPALRYSRPDLAGALQEGARGSGGFQGQRLRSAFVVAEIAFALVLLLGATLLLRTFGALRGVDPGFDASGVLTARLTLPGARYPEGRGMAEFVERLLGRIQSLPGVEVAAATNAAPLSRSTNQLGAEPENAGSVTNLLVDQFHVTPRYFQAMGIRLLAGRDFTWQDRSGDLVAIVDDVFARAAWPNQSPVGKYLVISGRRRVVGVIRQPRLYEVQKDDRPQVFLPYAQRSGITLVVRAKDPARLSLAVRQAVWAEDPAQPVATVRLMRDIVDASLADRRLTMLLLAFFAALAVLLATIGIYGVVAHVVGQRTREIGIRIALGAERSAIRGMVVKHAMRLAAIGVSLGLAAAFSLSRALETQLYGVSPRDPMVFAGAAAFIAAIALASSYLPALRASRIEPFAALRRE